MQFQLTGNHVEITEAMRAYATSKIDRLTRLEKCIGLTMVLALDNGEQRAEGTLSVVGATLHAQAAEADMYASIDVLIDKLTAQLRKHHDKAIDKHPQEAHQVRQLG